MKDTNRNDMPISPQVITVIRMLGSLAAIALIIVVGYSAVTFCLGLFADGQHVLNMPGGKSPIVSMQDFTQQEASPAIDPDEVVEIGRAEILVAGDIMLHMPIVRTNEVSGGYNFDQLFTHVKHYISAADYAVANLETTLSGTENGLEYTGAPHFNSPDAIATAAKANGFDMLLTATEHCYDYGTAGLKRTLSVIGANNLASLGTVSDSTQSRHTVLNIGGIQIGMSNYTFASIDSDGSQLTLNGKKTDSAASGLINAFDYDSLSKFYTEIEGEIAAMRSKGAESIVLFLHWGPEYTNNISDDQKSISQKLCDLGVDVIVGSHPHVVQAIDLLTSSVDHEHKTLCLYSSGNFVSNLRVDTTSMSTSHCEDSVMLRFTLAKYNDGTVRLSAVNLLPTWVMVDGTGATRDFYILPLDSTVTDWASAYELTSDQLSDAKSSYNRTMALITPGLNKVSAYLSESGATLDPSLGVG